jgi:hypothetical protein
MYNCSEHHNNNSRDANRQTSLGDGDATIFHSDAAFVPDSGPVSQQIEHGNAIAVEIHNFEAG